MFDLSSGKYGDLVKSVVNIGDSADRWRVELKGPKNTPYEHGVFKVMVTFGDNYPTQPPKCKFETKIWHPNIFDDHGSDYGHGANRIYQGVICMVRQFQCYQLQRLRVSILFLLRFYSTHAPKDTFKDQWEPVTSMYQVLVMIQCLMSTPAFDDPLNKLAAKHYNNDDTDDKATYNTIVTRYTDMYANERSVELRGEMVARIKNMSPDIRDIFSSDDIFNESKEIFFDEQSTFARLCQIISRSNRVRSEAPVEAKHPKTTGDVIDLTEDQMVLVIAGYQSI